MWIWGGFNGALQGTGAGYSPASKDWVTMSNTNAPSARQGHSAVWTGSEMIIWGGTQQNDGAHFRTEFNLWHKDTGFSPLDPRSDHSAVWTGEEMLIWGGYGNNGVIKTGGGRYTPRATLYFYQKS